MISIKVYDSEVLFRLDQIPKKLRLALRSKFEDIFSTLKEEIFSSVPGKYIDPKTIESNVVDQGLLTIGFIEVTDKPGLYVIVPSKALALRFIAKSGDLVFTKFVLHPFMKGAPTVAKAFAEAKPWIIDELEDALIEAL